MVRLHDDGSSAGIGSSLRRCVEWVRVGDECWGVDVRADGGCGIGCQVSSVGGVECRSRV
jgi:hypothetical protein